MTGSTSWPPATAAVPGLSTGLRDLDLAISGLNKSDLILLAARPGMGKTSMALNILLHAGKFSGKSVAFFSLEMSREQLALRLISNESFVDNKKLVTGKLTEERLGEGGRRRRRPEPHQDPHRRRLLRCRWPISTPSAAGWRTWGWWSSTTSS